MVKSIKGWLLCRFAGERHLIMLGITPLILAWGYVLVKLGGNDWDWVSVAIQNAKEDGLVLEGIGICGMILGFTTIMSSIVYCNVRYWLWPCVKRAFSLRCIIDAWQADYTFFDEDTLMWVWSSGTKLLCLLLALVWTAIRFIFFMLLGLGVIAASPLLALGATAWVIELVNEGTFAILGIGAAMFVGSILLLIVHPILCFLYGEY